MDYICYICERILKIYEDSHHIYGSPKITKELAKEGIKISQKTVLSFMHILGIKSSVYINFSNKHPGLPEKEKQLIENYAKFFPLTSINQVWVSDITYIKTIRDGIVYLASIMDLFSRKIIAWEVRDNMQQGLVIDVFLKAYDSRKPSDIVVVHSDKGSQYRAISYRQVLINHHCVFSYTSIGRSCDENSNQESFHSLLKKEWLYQTQLFTISDVKRECFNYIEGFYNTKRSHSALNFISPDDFENQLFS